MGPGPGPALKELLVWDGLGTVVEGRAGCCERGGLTEWRGKHGEPSQKMNLYAKPGETRPFQTEVQMGR